MFRHILEFSSALSDTAYFNTGFLGMLPELIPGNDFANCPFGFGWACRGSGGCNDVIDAEILAEAAHSGTVSFSQVPYERKVLRSTFRDAIPLPHKLAGIRDQN